MSTEQERADFEAFTSQHGLCITEDGDLYRSHVVAWMWKSWQARAALQSQDRDEGYRAMAAEYQRWIDAYHQGMDYEDFLKKRPVALKGDTNATV